MTRRKRQQGASYVEVLVAAVLLSVALAPMMDAIRSASNGAEQQQETVELHYRLTAMLEVVLAEPHGSLADAATAAGSPTTASSYSDAPGTTNRRLVFLSPYDGDNADADNDPFTGTDAGLIWIRVEIENHALSVESLSAL